MIKVRNIALKNNVLLAPMSGISDVPFRKIVFDLGAGLVVSEMVASEELAKNRPDVVLRATNHESIFPFAVQLAGREPEWMAQGARIAEAAGADIIDINMGCPARQVTGALSGSALMRNSDHALDLIKATVNAVDIPVTLKMRLGWDQHSLNAPEIAARAEEAGIVMFTVHGRTRQQFFKGKADWSAVKTTVNSVSCPVIVNGDISSGDDARLAIRDSGAHGVMIGRAAEGQPWLLRQITSELEGTEHDVLPMCQKAEIAVNHYNATIHHYTNGHNGGPELGRALGIRMARKHLAAYIDKLDRPIPESIRGILRRTICRSDDPAKVTDMLEAAFLANEIQLAKLAA